MTTATQPIRNLAPQVIIKAGTHPAADGSKHTITVADLQEAAAAYNPALHEAPWCIGHPKDNAPAWGWIERLRVDGEELVALSAKMAPEFLEWVGSGHFLKKSASFYLPNSPINPCPGKLYLRHVAALGAQPPAVKGLPDLTVVDCAEGKTIDFEEPATSNFSDGRLMLVARQFRSLREFLLVKEGQEVADRVLPDYALLALESAARSDNDDDLMTPIYKEPSVSQTEIDLAAENKQLKDQLARQVHIDFAEKLCGDGKDARLLPRRKQGLIEFMASLPNEGTVQFGEDETKSPLEYFKDFLKSLPPEVDFAERAGGPAVAGSMPEPQQLAQEAHSYVLAQRKEGHELNYSEAVAQVSKKYGAPK